MYYEDEGNLYHYSYRKGDKAEPIYTRNYAEEKAEPAVVTEEPKKQRTGLKLVALALVCALIGGAVGAGAMGAVSASMSGSRSGGTSTVSVSDRKATTSVQNVKIGTKALTMSEVYEQNIDSVVSINTTITRNVFNQIVENAASGSGFIITSDGYIVTNYHVIEGANTVKVTLHNGETYDAEVIGGDEDYDIAVLKIDAQELQRVTIGDSSTLKIGEDIAAIGNPLGELTFSRHRFLRGPRDQCGRYAVQHDPGRLLDQPRQLRRPAVQYLRRGRGHCVGQVFLLLQHRGGGHRLRHPDQ